ncbi:MAG: tetratricopeptide repeat protein [Acidobacteria bacterium]|nr:tetratricopeptide repeat protein [Acidobacteriota bacterium]
MTCAAWLFLPLILSSKAVVALILSGMPPGLMMLSLGFAEGGQINTPPLPVLHALRGKVIPIGDEPLRSAKVRLASSEGKVIGERLLGYEGGFVFANLRPGKYQLTLEREEQATIARSVEIKSYLTPKVVFLEITLNIESASVREIVTDPSSKDLNAPVEEPTRVSHKALRAFEQAAEESARGNHAKAIGHLEEAIREQPDYFEAYNNLGVQHQKLRQWEQAIQAFRRAIELRSHSPRPHVNLANAYWELGRIQAAIESLEAARKVDPRSAHLHSALGQLYFRKQDYVKAQESLETATRLSPGESRRAFVLLVQIALLHQNSDRARHEAIFSCRPGSLETQRDSPA